MDQPVLLQRQPNYPSSGHHLQRAQTSPMARNDDLLFTSPTSELGKRTASTSPSKIPISHSRAQNTSTSGYSTPMSITPSTTPPLVVNGVPLTHGAILHKSAVSSTTTLTSTMTNSSTIMVPRSTPSIAQSAISIPSMSSSSTVNSS